MPSNSLTWPGLEGLDHALSAAMRRIHLSDLMVTGSMIAAQDADQAPSLAGALAELAAAAFAAGDAAVHRERNPRDPGPRPLAGAGDERSEQPGLGPARGDRARASACSSTSACPSSGKFSCGTCHVPERNWTDNRVARRRRRRSRPQHADADERAPRPLVRLGRRRRQPVVAEHPADPRPRASWAPARATSPS